MNEITATFPPDRPEGSRGQLARSGTALAHTVPAEKAPHTLDVNEVWRVLMKWRWLILGMLIASVAIAIIVTLSTTPVYRATATLEINTEPLQVMQQQTDVVAPASRNEAQFLATQIGLLSSRTLAERVMRTVGLADDDDFVKGYTDRGSREGAAVAKLMIHLEVTPLRGSNLIMIGYGDPDPARAARIINAFAQGFIDSTLERRYNATAFARQFLQSRLDATRGKLETSERALVAYARSQNILSLSTGSVSASGGKDGGDGSAAQDSLSAQSLVSYNEALSAATRDRIAAEQAYRQSAATAGAAAQSNPAIQQLRSQLAGVQADYQQKLGTYRPDYPEMVALRQRMDAITRSIAGEARTVSSAERDTLRSSYVAARGREQQLLAQVNTYRSNVLDLRNRGIQYNILQRDIDTNRSIYDALLQRFKEIGAAGGVGESEASIVDNGTPPSTPYTPNVFKNLAIGLLAGLVVGLGTAFAIEFVDDTIKTPDDVTNKLGVPLLGVVRKSSKGTSFLDELKDQRSDISEAYYTIMSSIQFVAGSTFPRTALVTSTRPSEGKSSSSLALAQNLARVGASVLLVDADMRKPSFKTSQPDEIGLSTLLMSSGKAMEHVATTAIPNLSLLPSGPVPPNPAELLATSRISAILAELTAHFDIVLVDSPPVLGLADVPVLSAICDATILVVEAGSVRRPAVLSSLRRLIAANGHVVGAVLTKYNPKNGGYGYGYGYGYGNGYGYGYGVRKAQRYGEDAEIRQLDIDRIA